MRIGILKRPGVRSEEEGVLDDLYNIQNDNKWLIEWTNSDKEVDEMKDVRESLVMSSGYVFGVSARVNEIRMTERRNQVKEVDEVEDVRKMRLEDSG